MRRRRLRYALCVCSERVRYLQFDGECAQPVFGGLHRVGFVDEGNVSEDWGEEKAIALQSI